MNFPAFKDKQILEAQDLNRLNPFILSMMGSFFGTYAVNCLISPKSTRRCKRECKVNTIQNNGQTIEIRELYALNENGFPFFIEQTTVSLEDKKDDADILFFLTDETNLKEGYRYQFCWGRNKGEVMNGKEGECLSLLRYKGDNDHKLIPRPHTWGDFVNAGEWGGQVLDEKYQSAREALKEVANDLLNRDTKALAELWTVAYGIFHAGNREPTALWIERTSNFVKALEQRNQLDRRQIETQLPRWSGCEAALDFEETVNYLEEFTQYMNACMVQRPQTIEPFTVLREERCFPIRSVHPVEYVHQFNFEVNIRQRVTFEDTNFYFSSDPLDPKGVDEWRRFIETDRIQPKQKNGDSFGFNNTLLESSTHVRRLFLISLENTPASIHLLKGED